MKDCLRSDGRICLLTGRQERAVSYSWRAGARWRRDDIDFWFEMSHFLFEKDFCQQTLTIYNYLL